MNIKLRQKTSSVAWTVLIVALIYIFAGEQLSANMANYIITLETK